MSFLDTHSHNQPVTVGGVTLARVIEIINGYTITFENGQYAVNLVGGNTNIADVTNVNQVSVRSANSAGLTYSKEIEDQSFIDGRIWTDNVVGGPGSQYPRGTTSYPVDNLTDAYAIMINRGLPRRVHLNGYFQANTAPTSDWSHSDFLGRDPTTTGLIFSGQDVHECTFRRLYMAGYASGNFSLEEGIIEDFSNFEGDASKCGLLGTITLPSSGFSNSFYSFLDCFSLIPGTSSPIIDCNNHPNLELQLRPYTGGIRIKNYSDANNLCSVDLLSGHLIIDSTCTAGTIVVRGTGHITDESGGAVTVIRKGLSPVWTTAEKDSTLASLTSIAQVLALLQKYEENRSVIDKDNNTLTIYDDDDVTPILTFALLDSTGTPSTDEVAERVPQ
jgi:hypothetical protein